MSAPRADLTLKRAAGRREEVRVLTLEVAGWLSSTLCPLGVETEDMGEELFRSSPLQSGTLLLALLLHCSPPLKEQGVRVPHPEAKPLTFQARDNLALFIRHAVREYGIRAPIEVEDIVAQRDVRGALYFILALAKQLYLRHGVKPPEVVAMEMEIDDLRSAAPQRTEAVVGAVEHGRALEFAAYQAAPGDYIDAWIEAFVNQNEVPLVAQPRRLPVPPEGGQYVFPYEKEGDGDAAAQNTIYHVRMVRGTPLYRDGGEWKEFAELIRSKMQAAGVGRKLNLPEGVKPPRPLGEPIVQEAMEHLEELKAIEKDKVIYVAGRDEHGRAVVVIVGSRIPPLTDQRMYHVLLFLALTLDKVGRSDYVVLYCHTRAKFARKYFKWIKEARTRLPYVWKKNLAELVVVHPSIFIKGCFGFMRPFISSKFWRKLHYFNSRSTDQLNEIIAPLEAASILPAFINLHGKHQYEAGKLFGGTLDTARLRDLGQGDQYAERVPRVVHETVEYLRSTALDEEGIFRVPGPKKDEETVRGLYEHDDDVMWLRGTFSPHVAASVLKGYLRELGEPLLPEALYDRVLLVGDAVEAGDDSAAAQGAAAVVADLPEANRHVLAYLAAFLAQVAAHADQNKMDASNLAVVFAPNLVRRGDEAAEAMMENSKRKAAAVRYVIEHYGELFDSNDAAGDHDGSDEAAIAEGDEPDPEPVAV